MSVVLNEAKEAERILEYGEVGSKPTATLFLLAKYFRQKNNMTKEQTVSELNSFMIHYYKNYNPALWEDIIEDISKKPGKYSLREIDHIEITHKEIETINTVPRLPHRKLLFSMLCYARLYNKLAENNNGWINTDIKEVYRVSRVTVKHREDKFLFLNDLESDGLISFSKKNDNLNIKVNFVDSESLDDIAMIIEDFRELGYEYLNYIGDGKFIRCKDCHRLTRSMSNKKTYCNVCAKKRIKESNKKSDEVYKLKKRENRSVDNC